LTIETCLVRVGALTHIATGKIEDSMIQRAVRAFWPC
jgi:hypothetical protein